MKTNFARRVVSFVSTLSILLQSFAPIAYMTPQAAFSQEPLTSTATYNNSQGVFHFKVNNKDAGVTSGLISYSLSYKNELTGQNENVNGSTELSDNNFSRDIDAATCSSGDVCVKHVVNQGLIKIKINNANWFNSQWFKIEGGSLVVKHQYTTGSVADLSSEEEHWVNTGEEISPSPTPTVEPTVEPTTEPTIAPTEVPTPTVTVSPTIAPLLGDEEVQVKIVKLDGSYADPSLVPETWTDKMDYAPTEKVVVSGKNFIADYEYTIVISSTDDPAVTHTGTFTSLNDGTFSYEYQLDGNYRPNYAIQIKDGSGVVVANTTFTDSRTVNSVTVDGGLTTTVFQGDDVAVTIQTTTDWWLLWDNNWGSTDWRIGDSGPWNCVNHGNHSGDGTYSESFDVTAPNTVGTYNISFHAYRDSICLGGQSDKKTLTNAIIVKKDTTPPEVTEHIDGTLGNNEWYTSNVAVTWTVNDGESEVTSQVGCGATNINTNTAGRTITCVATSNGGTTTKTIIIKRDVTKPTITFNNRTAPNPNGWNSTDVTVNWSCADAMSGPVSSTISNIVTVDGDNLSSTGTCVDMAGNSRSNTRTGIKIDKTAPPVPTLSSPSNGSYVNTAGLVMQWNSVTDVYSNPVTYNYRSFWTGGGSTGTILVGTDNFINASNTSENIYTWQVQACDTLEHCSEWSPVWTVTVDNTAPTADISYSTTAPTNGDVTATLVPSEPVTITSVGGSTHVFTANSSFTFTFEDAAGNTGSKTATVSNIDRTVPSVPTGIYYRDTDNGRDVACGNVTNTKHLDVHWAVNPETDFDHYEYISFNADGSTGPVRRFDTNYFNASWWTIPTEGTYGAQIRAVDKAGNTSEWFGGVQGVENSCQYIVDWTAPTISVTNPNTLPAHSKTVKATTTEGTLTMVETTGTVCDSSLTGFAAYSDKTYSAESDNGTKICYRAEDVAGNVSYELSKAIEGIDLTAPVVEITAPTVASTNSNIDIRGTVKDENPHHYWLVIQNSSGTTIAGPGTVNDSSSFEDKLFFTWNVSSVLDGVYTIKLEARDAADNKDSHSIASRTIRVDKTAPVTTVSGIDTAWHKNPVTVNFTCADTGGVGCDKTYYAIDGGTITEGTSVTLSTEGQYAITYYSTDLLGNTESVKDAGTVKVDTTKPTSIISSPDNDGTNSIVYTSKWDGSMLGSASDTLSDINRVELSIKRGSDDKYWNGGDWVTEEARATASGTIDWNYALTTPPSEDAYQIVSHAVDNAGNVEDSYKLTIVLDKTIPEVAISLNPTVGDAANGWYKTQPEVTLTGTDTYLDGVQYQWDSQSGTWTNYVEPFKPGTEGSHILYYRAHDKANNFSGVGIKNIAWNKTALKNGPLNVNVSPNPTSETTSKVKWEAAASDTIGIDKYEVQWKLKNGTGSTYTVNVGNDVREYTVYSLTEGVWEVKVTALDASGNNISASADLTVDRTGPSSPTLSILGTGVGSVSLSWSKIDEANNYIIWYGTVPGSYQYGAKVGDTQSYTVQGLGAGSYYFIVKAVDASGNQSGNSNEVSTGAIVGAPGVAANTPAQGFSENVLGANTLTPAPSPTGSVLGVTKNINNRPWWWPWILVLLLPIGWFGYKKWKNRKG